MQTRVEHMPRRPGNPFGSTSSSANIPEGVEFVHLRPMTREDPPTWMYDTVQALPVLMPDSRRDTERVKFFSPGFLSGYPMSNDFALVVSTNEGGHGDERPLKDPWGRSGKPELVVFSRNMGGNITEVREGSASTERPVRY